MKLKVTTFLLNLYVPGLTLLEMKNTLNDSRNLLSNWQPSDESPCQWTGITCHPQDQQVSSMYVRPFSSIFHLCFYAVYFEV